MQFCSGTHLGVSAVLYAIIQQHTQIADAIYELRAASTAAAAAAASLSKCTIAHILGCSVISVYFKSSRMSMQFGLNSLSLSAGLAFAFIHSFRFCSRAFSHFVSVLSDSDTGGECI